MSEKWLHTEDDKFRRVCLVDGIRFVEVARGPNSEWIIAVYLNPQQFFVLYSTLSKTDAWREYERILKALEIPISLAVVS
jgi:hypothetical protein